MKSAGKKLTENHTRSLTSALMIVEQMLIEIRDVLLTTDETCCLKTERDVLQGDKEHDLRIVSEALQQIGKLAEKYQIRPNHQSLKRIINAKRTKIWEVLCDMKSRKQKGFGEFPKELVKEYDKDIDELLQIVEKIGR